MWIYVFLSVIHYAFLHYSPTSLYFFYKNYDYAVVNNTRCGQQYTQANTNSYSMFAQIFGAINSPEFISMSVWQPYLY
ncbi:hypothetical protein XNA1_2690029 [Xenorhabdus nematophila str. Anatoliense]|nr:hypothetical protein XNA1_2690029 [Xenorhabdus nematophila str. Anatoliense]